MSVILGILFLASAHNLQVDVEPARTAHVPARDYEWVFYDEAEQCSYFEEYWQQEAYAYMKYITYKGIQ